MTPSTDTLKQKESWEDEFAGRLESMGLHQENIIQTILAIRSLLHQTQQAYEDRFKKIIGEDEKETIEIYETYNGVSNIDYDAKERNDFRHELLQKLEDKT